MLGSQISQLLARCAGDEVAHRGCYSLMRYLERRLDLWPICCSLILVLFSFPFFSPPVCIRIQFVVI
jgi:hypothetical protein